MTTQEHLNAIAAPLLAWYDENRRDLPWRGTGDPYKVWVSEIMLQQTRVAAVLPYYRRWMEALPDVAALAAVEEGRLFKLWEGLGYYSRARNLQKAARMIVQELGGRFPSTYAELLRLPGVGEYTAGAVASIAFGEAVPAADGNVLRVAARVAAVEEDVLDPGVRRQFRQWMLEAVPPDRPGDFNQALMDLGATVCLPNGAPLCGGCPLSSLCAGRAAGRAAQLPVKRKKAARRLEELTVFLPLSQGRTALRKRPDTGLLAGLWEFPHVPGRLDEAAAAAALGEWGLVPIQWRQRLDGRHVFTHVEWRMTGYLVDVRGEGAGLTWADGPALSALAVPSAFSRFLAAVKAAIAAGADRGEDAEPSSPAGS